MLQPKLTDPIVLPQPLEDFIQAHSELSAHEVALYRHVWEQVIVPGNRLFTVTTDEELAQALSITTEEAKRARCSMSEKGLVLTVIKTRFGRCVTSAEAPIWKAAVGQYGLSVGVPDNLEAFLRSHKDRKAGMSAGKFFVELMTQARVSLHGAMIVGKKQYPEDVLTPNRG